MRRIALALACLVAQAASAQTASTYRITHSYALGGDGSWDYVVPDPARHRVFIGRQNRVMVVDENDGHLLGEVTGINGAHGVALSDKSGHGFATSGNDSSVVMFDLATFKALGRAHAAEDADAIVYEPVTNRVFTFNGDAHSSTVIDAATGKLLGNVPLGGKPEYGAVTGDGKVYGNLTDTHEVVEIDARTMAVSRRWPTAPCKNPVAMALDVAHHRLFSGCRSGVMAISDYATGKVVATVPIGMGVDGAAYDPATGDAFAAAVDGTLTVIHQDGPDAYHVVQTLQTAPASRNVGLDPTTHRLFIPSAKMTTPTGGGRAQVVPGSFAVLVVERASGGEQAAAAGPYRVLKTARVGGEGGSDYIYADVAGRRLYIPRGGTRAAPATASTAAVDAIPGRITVFDLETLAPLGEIPGTGGNGVAVDPASGHGFSSSKPVTMFDTRTLKVIKTIDVGAAQPDGIYFDAFNGRVYIFSHPTKDATVIDAKDGSVLGTIDLGGVPEQAVSDGKGTLYVVMQDAQGGVAVVDVSAMKTTAHYPFGDHGRCNGLALDNQNHVLFAACATSSGGASAPSAAPAMVVLSAGDGKILTTLPLAGASDGAVFDPATMEAFSSHGNGTLTVVKETSPTKFEVEQDLQTMNGARTLTLDTKTHHILTMSVERGPAPPPPTDGSRPGQAPTIPGSFTVLVIGK